LSFDNLGFVNLPLGHLGFLGLPNPIGQRPFFAILQRNETRKRPANRTSKTGKAVYSTAVQSRVRCYDFLNVLAEKIGEKIGVFDSKQS
jgi:hypothetical protein